MFLFVLCFNLILALVNIAVAIRLYHCRRQLQRLTQCLDRWDQASSYWLDPMGDAEGTLRARLENPRQTLARSRQRYRQLERQWLMVQQLWQLQRFIPRGQSRSR